MLTTAHKGGGGGGGNTAAAAAAAAAHTRRCLPLRRAVRRRKPRARIGRWPMVAPGGGVGRYARPA
eukprot:2409277-Prymnesium_polylepis.1